MMEKITYSDCEFDKRVLGHLAWMAGNGKVGTRTWRLSRRHNCSTTYMRRQLIRLEKSGKVKRNERYTAVNDIFWEIVT